MGIAIGNHVLEVFIDFFWQFMNGNEDALCLGLPNIHRDVTVQLVTTPAWSVAWSHDK